MAIVERIFTVYNDKGSKQAVKDLAKLEKQFAEAGKKMAKAFGVAALAVGAFAVKLGVDAVKAAMEDQKSQALLANSLRNTTGATDAAIASVESYISAQEKAVSVADDELRPSLSTLVAATKDVAQAQALQALALDVSAGSGRDLQSVSMALAKAIGGNFGALTKLGVPLSDNIKKNKDLNGALKELAKTFSGAAEAKAGTFAGRMEGLKIAFDNVLETIGYALLPVLENFAKTISTDLLPKLEEFATLNKEQIASALESFAKFAVNAAKGLVSLFNTISNNLTTFKVFTALLVATFVGGKVAAGVMAVQAAVKALTIAFRGQAIAGTAAGTATAFATGGTSALAAAAGIGAFAIAAGVAYKTLNNLVPKIEESTSAFKEMGSTAYEHLKDLDIIAQKVALANSNNLKVTTTVVKKTQEQINLEKILAKLKSKFGVVPTTENDPIQLEAARLNLIRQGKIAEAAAVAEKQRLLAEQLKLNDAAMKYNDILALLGDRKLSPEEIALLAQKWGMSNTQVLAYLQNIFGIEAVEGGYDFSASGKDAEDGWTKALAALNAYKNGLATIGKGIVPKEEDRATRGYGTGSGTGSGLITLPNGKTVDPTNTFTVAGKTIIANSGIIQSDTTGDTSSMTAARQRIADIFATIGAFGGQGYVPKGGVSNTSGSTNITVNVQGTLLDTGGLKTAVVNAVTEAGFSGRNTTYNRGLISE